MMDDDNIIATSDGSSQWEHNLITKIADTIINHTINRVPQPPLTVSVFLVWSLRPTWEDSAVCICVSEVWAYLVRFVMTWPYEWSKYLIISLSILSFAPIWSAYISSALARLKSISNFILSQCRISQLNYPMEAHLFPYHAQGKYIDPDFHSALAFLLWWQKCILNAVQRPTTGSRTCHQRG